MRVTREMIIEDVVLNTVLSCHASASDTFTLSINTTEVMIVPRRLDLQSQENARSRYLFSDAREAPEHAARPGCAMFIPPDTSPPRSRPASDYLSARRFCHAAASFAHVTASAMMFISFDFAGPIRRRFLPLCQRLLMRRSSGFVSHRQSAAFLSARSARSATPRAGAS